MSRHKDFGFKQGRRGSPILWIFIGVLAFCLVFFPLLGVNLSYYIGTTVTSFFAQIGTILGFIGNLLIAVGAVYFFIDRRKGIKYLLIAVIFIIGGMFFLDPLNFGYFDWNITQQGYH